MRTQDDTFGPETRDRLIEWAKMGRIQPGQDISNDGENWKPAVEIPFLDMRWSIDIGDGRPRGPFNRHAAEALLKSGRLPPGSKLVEVAPAFEERRDAEPNQGEPVVVPDSQPEPEPTGTADVRIVEKVVEVPVEKVVEKVVEVPVEKVVEKIVEVPVEKIVEKERIVEVESSALLAKAAALEAEVKATKKEMDKALTAAHEEQELALSAVRKERDDAVSAVKAESEKAMAAAKEEHDLALTAEREESERAKKELAEAKKETLVLENEIRRLPSNAREAADTEAAVYWLMRGEADDLQRTMEAERVEAEEAQKRWRERADRLNARRVEILKRIGDDAKDMKNRALRANPADPRTVQLKQELEALRIVAEKNAYESAQQVRDLTRALNEKRTEADRLAAQVADVKSLQAQIQDLRERLQVRDRELMLERQAAEEFRRNAEATQQALLRRLSEFEGGLPGRSSQHKDANAQSPRFPVWMSLKK